MYAHDNYNQLAILLAIDVLPHPGGPVNKMIIPF